MSGAADDSSVPPRNLLPTALIRMAGLFAIWFVLAEGRTSDLATGLVVAAGTAAASLRLLPPRPPPVVLPRLLRMIPYIAWLSLKSGFDVATRALFPGTRIDPDLFVYRLDSPDARIALTLAYIMTLLPGTLATDVRADRILVHALDRTQPIDRMLRQLETELRGRRTASASGGPHG